MGRSSEFFENFDGIPTEMYWTDDYETQQEKLFNILNTADINNWVMTASIQKRMKTELKEASLGKLKELGLKNLHSYTLIDVREVTLENKDIEYLLFMRNPTGNFFLKDYEVWKGDWGPLSEKWNENPKLREQLGYTVTLEEMNKAK